MVTAYEANLLYMRKLLGRDPRTRKIKERLTLKDLEPDTFESNEKSKLFFRQWSDDFSSWIEKD